MPKKYLWNEWMHEWINEWVNEWWILSTVSHSPLWIRTSDHDLSPLTGPAPQALIFHPLSPILDPLLIRLPPFVCPLVFPKTHGFSRFGWIITEVADRSHLPPCCVMRVTFHSEARLIWNSTCLHAAGQKWQLFNMYLKICNNLSRTKWYYRHAEVRWFSHMGSSECVSVHTCTHTCSVFLNPDFPHPYLLFSHALYCLTVCNHFFLKQVFHDMLGDTILDSWSSRNVMWTP
jgi:hypothetical protein